MMFKILTAIAALSLMVGCANNPYSYPDPAHTTATPPAVIPAETAEQKPPSTNEQVEQPTKPVISPSSAQANQGSVADKVVADGWGFYKKGEIELAISSGERALRMDRRNPEVYLLLAKSHQHQYRYDLAAQLARQGLHYSPEGSKVEKELQQLLRSLGQ